MKRSLLLATLLSLAAIPCGHATLAEAQRIQKTHKLALDKWSLEMRLAATPEERSKIWNNRPDATPFARDMWDAISLELDKDWILEPAAWFIEVTPGLFAKNSTGVPQPIFAKENAALRKAIETHHITSPKMEAVCAALAAGNDPRSLSLLEKIQSSHPDPKIQGMAALGAAMQLKTLGDSGDIMRRRLTYLKKAIIQSPEMPVGNSTVAKIAEDELHIILHLTKGRVAPDLVGADTAGRPISLSSHQGKVILVVFWNSNVPDAQRVVDLTTAMESKYRGKPFVVMGVNNDTAEKLRTLQADGTVPWTNFSDPDNKLSREYRIGTWPLVYVLDKERKVQYAGAPGSFAEATVDALLNPGQPNPR